jgi:hypothetical protein
MGLWTYCFDHFRHPHYQFDKLFDGCNSVFNEDTYVIREWLLPGKKNFMFTFIFPENVLIIIVLFKGWLLSLELFMTLALVLSLGTLAIIAAVITRYPQRIVLKYEYMLSAACFIATSISGL